TGRPWPPPRSEDPPPPGGRGTRHSPFCFLPEAGFPRLLSYLFRQPYFSPGWIAVFSPLRGRLSTMKFSSMGIRNSPYARAYDFRRWPSWVPWNYLARKMIRALVKSYGDNSTSTLSPGTIR